MDWAGLAAPFAITFGEDLLYAQPPGDPVTRRGVVSSPINDEEGQARSVLRIWFVTDPSITERKGDVITRNGTDYTVFRVHPDEQGGVWVNAR